MKKIWIVALVLGLLFAAGCKKRSSQVESQKDTVAKIAKLEQSITSKQEEMNTLLRKYMQEGGKEVGTVMGQTLTPDQKALLEERLKKEEGIGYKDLISDILQKQKEMEDLKVQIQDLEKKLPSAVVARRGDRQFDICMEFLKEKGITDQKEAKKLIYQNNLMDELVPGFKIWHFYDNGVYVTTVTQGDASVSPYRVTQRIKEKLVSEKETALTQRDSLAKEKNTLLEQVADLEARRNQLNQDVAMLQAERESLLKKIQEVQDLSEDLRARLNSIFYKIGDRQALIGAGIVKDPWYGQPTLTKFEENAFPNHLDLRSGDTITFTAQEAGVQKISKVKLAPGNVFKETVDYSVTIAPDGKQATAKLLNRDKFRAERTMVVLVN